MKDQTSDRSDRSLFLTTTKQSLEHGTEPLRYWSRFSWQQPAVTMDTGRGLVKHCWPVSEVCVKPAPMTDETRRMTESFMLHQLWEDHGDPRGTGVDGCGREEKGSDRWCNSRPHLGQTWIQNMTAAISPPVNALRSSTEHITVCIQTHMVLIGPQTSVQRKSLRHLALRQRGGSGGGFNRLSLLPSPCSCS